MTRVLPRTTASRSSGSSYQKRLSCESILRAENLRLRDSFAALSSMLPIERWQPCGRGPLLTVIIRAKSTKKTEKHGRRICKSCNRTYPYRQFQELNPELNPAQDGRGERSWVCRGCTYMDENGDTTHAGNILLQNGGAAVCSLPAARCSQCREKLPATFFLSVKKVTEEWKGRCHACTIGAKHIWNDHIRKIPLRKVCKGPLCRGKELPCESFHRIKKAKDGLQEYCKECQPEIKQLRTRAAACMPPGCPQAALPRLCTTCWQLKPPQQFVQISYKRKQPWTPIESARSDCEACHAEELHERRAARLADKAQRL